MRRYLFLILTLPVLFLPVSFAQAATYYVSPTGNDSYSGLSDAQAWRSVSKVNSFSFATGDDVYFKCGGIWTGQALAPNLRGANEGNRAVIGAYYQGGTIGVSGDRPVIDGNNGSVPTPGSWAALVQFSGVPYVTVQDLEVRWSGDRGIAFNACPYAIVRNCYIISSYGAGILFEQGSNYSIAEFNALTDTGRSELLGLDWPATLCVMFNTTNCTARYNYLLNNHGEGIGFYSSVSDSVAEYNTIVNSKAPNVYFTGNAKRNIARYNLIYGYAGAPWETEGGIVIDDEGQFNESGTEGSKIYGNFIANTACGVGLQTWSDQAIVKDTEVYSNTLIDNTIAFRSWDRSGPFQNSYVKYNIIWITGQRSGCSFTDIPSATGIIFDYNLWSSQPSPSFLRGTHDSSS